MLVKRLIWILLFLLFSVYPLAAQSSPAQQNIIESAPKQERPSTSNGPTHTGQHQKGATNQQQPPDKPSTMVNKNKSVEKYYSTQNSRHDEDENLKIQRQLAKSSETIADFTVALVIATLILAIIAIGQGWLSWKTLTSTQRAFVFLKDIEFIEIRGDSNTSTAKWQFFPHWENSGYTPTKNLTISVGCDHFLFDPPNELPDDFDFPYVICKDIPMMIGPKTVIVSQAIELSETNIVALEFITGTHLREFYKVYMWGEAKYRDVFWWTRQHITRFCVELFFTEQLYATQSGIHRKAPIMSFNYYKKYNYAD